jgi:glyoxylase-like metal-dependent hydrolase (beta-lactamase superfamily II)/rhodanese-related sulfurtransferase
MSPERNASITAGAAVAVRPVVEQTRVDGCLSYLVFDPDSKDAAVIDPRFDGVDNLLKRLQDAGLRLRCAIDTHAHADHLSGVARLATETGAQAVVPGEVTFPARRVGDGDRVDAGSFGFAVLATPGHTSDSITLRTADVVFTGDALLIGGAGRTDFQNGSPETLFESFETRLRSLPAATVVYPGHDYKGRTHSTVGDELRANALFGNRDRASFVARLESGSQAEPANMKFVLSANRAGAKAGVATIDAMKLCDRLKAGERLAIVDVRTPAEFAGSRIHGARNVPLPQITPESIAPNEPAVLVCEAGVRATMAATTFAGRPGVLVLTGGMSAWRSAGLPTDGSRGRVWPIERQVRFVIGICVVLGTALAVFVDPWFAVVPAFFGAGLIFSAVTGKCGMAVMLARMPWNRKQPAGSCAPSSPAGGSCAAPSPPGGGGGCAAA